MTDASEKPLSMVVADTVSRGAPRAEHGSSGVHSGDLWGTWESEAPPGP